jgi:hypothetical protein
LDDASFNNNNKGGASHCGLALPFTLKKYFKAKEEEELWKLKYFTIAKI